MVPPATALNPAIDPLTAIPQSPGVLSEHPADFGSPQPGVDFANKDNKVESEQGDPNGSRMRKMGDGLSQAQSLNLRGSMSDFRAQVQM